MRVCANGYCGWRGEDAECLDLKHPVGEYFCPKCHEVTEDDEEEEDKMCEHGWDCKKYETCPTCADRQSMRRSEEYPYHILGDESRRMSTAMPEFSQEQIDEISVKASKLVADDFAAHGDERKPPSITPGMVLCTLKAAKQLIGNSIS